MVWTWDENERGSFKPRSSEQKTREGSRDSRREDIEGDLAQINGNSVTDSLPEGRNSDEGNLMYCGRLIITGTPKY